jgi:5-aminopentanamidase
MNLSVVQTNPTFGSKAANIREALSMMQTCHADLYVLPELFATGYNFVDKTEVRELAEPFDDGDTHKAMAEFACDSQCYVVFGFVESDGDRLFNSAAIVGYDGANGLYRKVHLFNREKLFFEPGDLGFRVFCTPFGKIGLMVCFDWYFPESARTLTLRGAQLIAHPSNLVLPDCPDGMRTRCLENRIFAVTANRVGVEDRGGRCLTYIGQSQIVSPRGEVIRRLSGSSSGISVVEIDLTVADDKNLNLLNHLLNDRKPEAYESGIQSD